MSENFDPNKPVKQRNGRPARIICKDAKGDKPIVALINYSIDEESQQYFPNGQFSPCGESSYDLINIEEPKLQLPITPGRYRMRDGREQIINKISMGDVRIVQCQSIDVDTGHIVAKSWFANGRVLFGQEHPCDLVERLPDEPESILKTISQNAKEMRDEKEKVIAAKYEGMPPYDEEKLRKPPITLESLNTKLDELLRRTETKDDPEVKTWIVEYKDITGEPKTATITSPMDKDDIQRLYSNSGYEVWSVT